MHREPTAISLVEIAIPNLPVRSQRPMSEKVTAGSTQTLTQVLGDLERARHALGDRLGQGHERVDLPGILAVDDVHAGLAKPIAVGPTLVAKRIKPGRDDHGRWLALEAGRTQRRGSQIGLVRVALQILLHVPEDPIARDHVAVRQLAVRARLQREVDGGIDEHLTRRRGHPAGSSELRDDGRQIPARRIAGHGDASDIDADVAALRPGPAIRRQAVLDRGRELVLGRQPIVDGHDEHTRVLGQPRAEAVMRLEIALNPAAAVEVRDGGLRRLRGARGVDARGNLARGPGNTNVLDTRQRRRGPVHQRHHHAELLAQLGQRRKEPRHADRFDEFADDLRLRIHRAAADPNAMTVEEAQRVFLAHRRMGHVQRRMRAHGRSSCQANHISGNVKPCRNGSDGSTPCWNTPVIHAWPAMVGTMPGRPPTVTSAAIVASNREPMIDSWMNPCPSPSCPRACSTASRAEVPVPHGLRSMRPGATITALRLTVSGPANGIANSAKVTRWMSVFSGWLAVSCCLAAATIRLPRVTRSRASFGSTETPSDGASTIAKKAHPYATSTGIVPRPSTSSFAPRCVTKHGTLVNRTRSTFPSRQRASTGTGPAGVSRVSVVTGSRIGSMPVSRSTVTVQIVFDPDIGG